uniref:Uncharacterized protein n=1 Tax=Arundo donax TaxID=35708 RepID=A0A0A9ANS5_ARUDO
MATSSLGDEVGGVWCVASVVLVRRESRMGNEMKWYLDCLVMHSRNRIHYQPVRF